MEKDSNLLNTVMNCEPCKYFTCNKRDFARHLKTKRHIERMPDSTTQTNKVDTSEDDDSYHTSMPDIGIIQSPPIDEYDDFVSSDADLLVGKREFSKKDTCSSDDNDNDNDMSMVQHVINLNENVVITNLETLPDEWDQHEEILPDESHDNKDGEGVVDESEDEDDREPIYETIYTNPAVAQPYAPGVFDFILYVGRKLYSIMAEIISDSSRPLFHDRI